ncbi:MAG: (2Fe-2S) ferredoxin domain-containing protein [Anaerolineales bacterium]|nr:(2Fe-2S) ferredoxin domain-containing protein [Anaerolineales bacterium]
MSSIKSLSELERLRDQAIKKRDTKVTNARAQITVGMGTCGIAAGARETIKAILETIEKENLSDILVKQTGCIGLCEWEPLVEVLIDDETVRYGKINADRAKQIMKEHIVGGVPVDELVVPADQGLESME